MFNCYDYEDGDGYDICNVKETETHLLENFGCVLPISNSSHKICENNTESILATKQTQATFGKFSPTCRNPCRTMRVTFGFPSFGECGKETGSAWVRLYFKQNIEVIQDRLNYSFLK